MDLFLIPMLLASCRCRLRSCGHRLRAAPEIPELTKFMAVFCGWVGLIGTAPP